MYSRLPLDCGILTEALYARQEDLTESLLSLLQVLGLGDSFFTTSEAWGLARAWYHVQSFHADAAVTWWWICSTNGCTNGWSCCKSGW
jgi:hypothetical protein